MTKEQTAVKAVLLNSGGLDTLVVAKTCHNLGYDLVSLTVRGAKRYEEKALEFAHEIAEKYCVEEKIIDISGGPYLCQTGLFKDIGMPYVKVFHLVMATLFAKSQGIDYIATGVRKDDKTSHHIFTYLNDLLSCTATQEPPVFIKPIFELREKEEVINFGLEQGLTKEEMRRTVDSDNVTAANTDFDLTANLATDLDHYYDGSNWVYFRVYQEAV